MHLDVSVDFEDDAERFEADPNLGPTGSERVRRAMMGDIVRTDAAAVDFTIDARGSAPIERIELRNGLEIVETWRPYAVESLGRRIRVIWEGSEYRGRGRQTVWDGTCTLEGNRFARIEPINQWNLDKKIVQTAPNALAWAALTTGGFGGFDAWLDDATAGVLRIDTPLVKCAINVADIGRDDLVFDAGGIRRRIRVFRLPDENPHDTVHLTRRVDLRKVGDDALYVCITQEDGHLIWSSPIYLIA